jgi:MFS family permease
VNHTTTLAAVIAVALIVFGGVTGWLQLRGLRRLAGRTHVPSDEYAYLRGRHRRRLGTAVLLAVIGGLIGGAFLSGLEPKVDALTGAENAASPPDEAKAKREMTPEEKQLVRVWVGYWVLVLVLVFVLLGFAFADALATRRYAMQQYAVIREEHQTKLRRDLAVYRAQKEANRGGRGGNRVGGDEP